MRWLYLNVVIVFVAVVIFGIHNRDMSFLGFALRAPVALLAVIVCVLGPITGGSLLSCCGSRSASQG